MKIYDRQQRYRRGGCLFLVFLGAPPLAHGQNTSPRLPLAGCYEVISYRPSPAIEDTYRALLTKFELTNKPYDNTGNPRFFHMRKLDRESNSWEALWNWEPTRDGHAARLNLSLGLGGYRGVLKQYSGGKLIGKIKQYCDSRCQWKRESIHISARRVDCGR
jgi:hypothetical protein